MSALALEHIIDHIPLSVFWKDRECRYLGCNLAFANSGGLPSPRDIVGLDDSDMPWRDQADLYRADDRQVMSTGLAKLAIEETFTRFDGTNQTIITNKVPLIENGVVLGVLGIYHDISSRKALENDLRSAKTAAELSDRSKGDFLAAMSHEIRTPLTLILAPLEAMLMRGTVTGAAADTLRTVFRNGMRLKQLTDDVLDFSKASAGFLTVRSEDVELGPYLKSTLDDLRPAASSRQLAFDVSGVTDVGTVRIDLSKVERIVTNLVGNAIKFTPAGGVSVWLKRDGQALELGVKDTGIGIDASHQHLLFQRFSQLEAGPTRRFDGTGLGLALVKTFAELMGGTIAVQSERGQGSTFVLRLPLVEGQANAVPRQTRTAIPAAAPTLPASRNLGDHPRDETQPRVLLCEDNAELRELVRDLLGDEFDVQVAHDGQDAWEQVQVLKPSVVVSDLMMPGVDGLELLRRIKADPELKRISVLMLTARAGSEASIDGLDAGADDYICKPFNPLELKARVRAAVRLSRLHGDLLKAEQHLHESERLAGLGRVLAKLSHEINNPVSVVTANLEPIERYFHGLAAVAAKAHEQPTPEHAALWEEHDLDFVIADFPDALTGMRHAARRIQDIQADLRRFLRTGESSQRTEVQLDGLARDVVSMWKRALPPDIRLEANLSPVPPLFAEALSLDRLVGNLIKNAAEAMGGPGVILVETEVVGGEVRLSVSDDGPGVPMAVRAKIFEPFFTTKDVGVGTGLGLAVCREIARGHGGQLSLDESYPHGARFVLSLPVEVTP